MANPEHLKKLLEGVEAWNHFAHWGADLRGAHLRSVRLQGYDLRGAQFAGADLRDAYFHLAICRGADFTNANLQGADFVMTDLSEAILNSADLGWATFGKTLFADTSLRDASLLYTFHIGRSSIGIDTFFKSGGLPEDFLRGCGVPEDFIAYAGSLIGKPIEYYSCFMSYSSKDDEFAHRLHADLQAKTIRAWFAPEDLKIGDRFRSRIDESIRVHDKLVLILSEDSINSAWVRREVETTLDREDREKRDVLFPIRVDDAIFENKEPWADEIRRTRHIGDFREWKHHDSYTKAFERLVKDLKKEGPIIMKA